MAGRRRIAVFVIFCVVVIAVIAIKSIKDGWFEPQTSWEPNGQPALIFFSLERGCACQMKVINNAEAQIAAWEVTDETGVPVRRVDFNNRRGQYGVQRAPALVLLDASGQVVWKQDVGLSDEAPLDLIQAQIQVETLVSDDGK